MYCRYLPDAVAVKLLDMYHNSQDLSPDSKQYNKYHTALVALNGKPDGINDMHWEALTSLLGVEDEISERDWQKESERVIDHERNKDEIIGDGGQENKAPLRRRANQTTEQISATGRIRKET